MDRRKMDLPDYVAEHGSTAELEKERSGICVRRRLSAHPWGLRREAWAGPGLWWEQRPRWRLSGCVSLGGQKAEGLLVPETSDMVVELRSQCS
jgi:hypothetical protein